MKIIYGVAGEGMGHAIRSSVVIQHLLNNGHKVHIVSSDRAAEFLHERFKKETKTSQISGLKISYKNNKVNKINTIITNFIESKNAIKTYKKLNSLFKKFKPDLVITDFEAFTYGFAKYNKIPIIGIDNIQLINRCKLEDGVKGFSYSIAKTIVKSIASKCDMHMITSFFDTGIKKNNTFIYKPILRPQIINAHVSNDGHILVYQTSSSGSDIIKSLGQNGNTFIVYGAKHGLTETEIDNNIIYKPFSEVSFINDLASCDAVISGGSFTVMSECIFLGKPLLSVPVEGQFEQEMNAYYLEKLGYGKYSKKLSSDIINDFIKNIDFYKEHLSEYKHNNAIFEDLDRYILGINDKNNKI